MPSDAASESVAAESRRPDALFLAIVAAFAVYALAFIWRTSFVIGGTRYFSLFDDGMISMRFARNLAAGQGLVWNAGERVEGITNPLWTGWMALLHLLPVPEAKTALLVQLTGVAILVANLFVVRALALRLSRGSRAVALGAAVLTATYLPLNNWTLQGMEVGLAALLVTLAAWLALKAMDEGRFPWAAYALLGAGTWVRIDLAVPLLALTGVLFLADRPHRIRHLVGGVGSLVLFLGVQTALRYGYYGDVLPNTYYLKMTGYPVLLRIARGAWTLGDVVWYANPLVFLAPLAIPLFRRDRAVWLLLALVAGQAAYSVYVGGDAWEWWGGANRYLCVAMPVFMVLLAYVLRRGTMAALDAAGARGRPLSARTRRIAWAAVVAFAMVSLNALKGIRSLPEWVGLVEPMHVRDNQEQVRVGLWVRAHTPPDAVIAVRWAGAMPYFAQRRAIDLLGKSDRRIARLPAAPPQPGFNAVVSFWPGHMKWDYAWSIGRLRPDLVFNEDYPEPLASHLGEYRPVPVDGGTVYVRRDYRGIAPG